MGELWRIDEDEVKIESSGIILEKGDIIEVTPRKDEGENGGRGNRPKGRKNPTRRERPERGLANGSDRGRPDRDRRERPRRRR